MEQIKGILFDIGGVLYNGEHLIDGAVETVAQITAHYPVRFLTNTTRKPPEAILKKMHKMGFDIKEAQLFTALRAARDFLHTHKATAYPLMTDEAAAYFDGFVSEHPDFVVVADAYTNFDYPHMNRAFRALEQGAELVAAAKNRHFLDGDGARSMDAGGFVAALEYASGKEAAIIGKPSRTFFHLAVSSMGLKPEEALMVGDDIESDIKGAQAAGLKAALVKTGKFRPEDLNRGISSDIILNSVNELPSYLSV